jgi:hypothetical protein
MNTLQAIKEAVERFERGELPPDEKRALRVALLTNLDVDGVPALWDRFQAAQRAADEAKAGRQPQPKPAPKPAAECHLAEESWPTDDEMVQAFKRELIVERRRRVVRKRRGTRVGRRMRGRSRCRRDTKGRSSARSGDGGPDGEPSPASERALAEAEQAIERLRRELADEEWSEQ